MGSWRDDTSTANTCPACSGRKVRTRELPSGNQVSETCPWCEGCGFVLPARAEEWRAYTEARARRT